MSVINVTAAIIENKDKILIAKRKQGVHLEGKWEFPGGKIEPGETPEEGLARELAEEFGITAKISDFLAESNFDYGDRQIKLLGYKAKYVSGEFKLNAHDEIKWVGPQELKNHDFAAADIPLVEKLYENL